MSIARPRTLLLSLVALTMAVGATQAIGAPLGGLVAEQLQAGEAPIGACDTNGVTVAYTTSGGDVTAVTVGGIADPGCEGGQLSVAVNDGDEAALAQGGPQTVPSDGDATDNEVTVTVSPEVDADEVEGVTIQILGP